MPAEHPMIQPMQIVGLEQGSDGSFRPRPLPDQEIQDIITENERVRNFMLERFQSDERGIDTGRVESFFTQKGLRTKPNLLISSFNAGMLVGELRLQGIHMESTHESGRYLNQLGFSYVVREEDYEETMGPEFSESIAVHEQSHSVSEILSLNAIQDSEGKHIRLRRDGFMTRGRGSFLAEAFAELMRVEYVVNEMGMPYGFLGYEGEFEDTGLPAKYAHVDPDSGEPDFVPSSLAAFGMELLIEKDSGIMPALYEACIDMSGIIEVARRIHQIKPGLFSLLHRLKYEENDFQTGLTAIKTAI